MSKTITIVGVGALGSHVALLLRNEGQLRIIDFDRVESKNTMSQFHAVGDTGQLKTTALSRALQGLFRIKAFGYSTKLVQENAFQLLHGSDLIIDCLDNAEGRQVVQSFARGLIDNGGRLLRRPGIVGDVFVSERPVMTSTQQIPCLHGGLAAGGVFGRAVWDEHFVIDEAPAGGATCEDGAFLPHIALVSATIAYAAQRFLRDGKRESFMITGATSTRL